MMPGCSSSLEVFGRVMVESEVALADGGWRRMDMRIPPRSLVSLAWRDVWMFPTRRLETTGDNRVIYLGDTVYRSLV